MHTTLVFFPPQKTGSIEQSLNTAYIMQYFPKNTIRHQVTIRYMKLRFPTPAHTTLEFTILDGTSMNFPKVTHPYASTIS
jgi:hypothetical protein